MKPIPSPIDSLTVYRIPQRRLFSACLLLLVFVFSSAATADANSTENSTVAYVDSIHQWGAWELDIEPAAGGIRAPSQHPLTARNSRVSLRTNSVSALAPQAPQGNISSGPAPIPPAGPTAPGPAAPGIRPISPNVPIPSSAPSDGF